MFEDEQNIVLWSEEAGRHKALSPGERKKAMRALYDARKKTAPEPSEQVLEAVSPEGIQCFVEYGNLMAILVSNCSNQLWIDT